MKTDYCMKTTVVVLLAGLLLAAGLPAAGGIIRLGRVKISYDSPSKQLAEALVSQVKEVQKRFDANRRALRTVRGPKGKPAYPRQEVVDLIVRTKEDLSQAIGQVGAELEPLRAWSDEEIGRIQEDLAGPSGQTAASFPSLSTPRAVAVVASLGSLPMPASSKAVAPPQDTISSEKTDSLLDQVGEVVSRIFFLASHDDLEVKLWFGSTPKPQATFSFWPQGKIKGSTPAPLIIRANDKRDRVLRGLYSYRAFLGQGAVSELVEYPPNPTAPAAQLPSERLDLVNGSSFFCCRFKEQYCHHVAKEKECRP